jgi:hypothetical protein
VAKRTLSRAALLFPPALALAAAIFAACGDSLADTRDVPTTFPWRGAGTESSNYAIKGPDNSEVAQGTLTVEEAGAQVNFIQHYVNPEGTDDVRVVADAQTLRPQKMTRAIRTKTLTRDIAADYGTDKVHVVITGDDTADEEIEFPPHAYDTEESLFLWRTLAFSVGYEVKYVSINPNRPTGRVGTAHVVAIESVTVPAGTFETWRVEASASGTRVVAWYDTQGAHRLVRYNSGDFTYELLP